jgi:hypothetical protein
VLDLWFERVVKSRLKGEAYLVPYIDDFVLCFQYRSDALRVQAALRKRLMKFSLYLEPTKTKLVEFGRFAQRDARKRGRKRPETFYFLGMVLYCTRNQKGNFKVGMRTEKSRLHRSLSHLRELMRRCRHLPVREQAININRVLRGHYAYYGIAGNFRALQRVHRATERYWRKMLRLRSTEAPTSLRQAVDADFAQAGFVRILPRSTKDAEPLAKRLKRLKAVWGAVVAPDPVPAAAPTGTSSISRNFEPCQGYLHSAPNGISAIEAWMKFNARGKSITICDIEGNWNFEHEDLPTLRHIGGTLSNDLGWKNHGTAVVGEMVSKPGRSGTVGISHGARMYV